MLELARNGPAPLTASARASGDALRIAAIIPSFRRGSGGHATIVHLLRALSGRGHHVSLWLEDCDGRHAAEGWRVTERSFGEFFAATDLPLHGDLAHWEGADVVLATGWQTVARALLLEGVGARAYLVQDHEPDFYAASAESAWAAQTYSMGLHCIAASPWLAGLLRNRYGASATHFDLAVDHAVYNPAVHAGPRDRGERELVLFYARAVTPRRAVPLGLLALDELSRRRPGLEIALFGEDRRLGASFRHRNLGLLSGQALAALYREASVGMVLSLTNPSLIGLEMMACGLPCVELASESMLATLGPNGPISLAQADPLSLCSAMEVLLDDPALRASREEAGILAIAGRTWDRAAEQVHDGLLTALVSATTQVIH
ncbi:MAG: glycosyltransferase family 4 protein [Solirubrobacteraceae bacterium]